MENRNLTCSDCSEVFLNECAENDEYNCDNCEEVTCEDCAYDEENQWLCKKCQKPANREKDIILKPYLQIYGGDILPKSREDPKYDKDIEIKVGHFVKLCGAFEMNGPCFWVEVLEVKPSSLKGRIDNDIESTGELMKYNDIIEFKWCHIMDHME